MNKKAGRQAQERRRCHRYDSSNISITLKSQSSSAPSDNNKLNIVDFNRYGLALCSDRSFRVGDTLSLMLSDQSGHEVNVEGFVCNRATSDEGFRCGLRFVESNAQGQTIITALLEMEQKLDKLAS